MNFISGEMHLSIDNINSKTTDEIIDCHIKILVHSISELKSLVSGLSKIENVYEIRRENGRIL
jgi:(p)ppGpp synthase/HD superfamily hydrolase